MTKRQVLLAICETPGWQPPEDSSSIDRSLVELQREGLVLPRLDGWEATALALEGYPDFLAHPDIAGEAANRNGEPASSNGNQACVPLERVEALLTVLLVDMPLGKVQRLCAITPEQIPDSLDPLTRQLAHEIAKGMR